MTRDLDAMIKADLSFLTFDDVGLVWSESETLLAQNWIQNALILVNTAENSNSDVWLENQWSGMQLAFKLLRDLSMTGVQTEVKSVQVPTTVNDS